MYSEHELYIGLWWNLSFRLPHPYRTFILSNPIIGLFWLIMNFSNKFYHPDSIFVVTWFTSKKRIRSIPETFSGSINICYILWMLKRRIYSTPHYLKRKENINDMYSRYSCSQCTGTGIEDYMTTIFCSQVVETTHLLTYDEFSRRVYKEPVGNSFSITN